MNDQAEGVSVDDCGYLRLARKWTAGDRIDLTLPIEPRFTVAHPSVDAVRGAVALERGPVVYAFESIDQGESIDLNHVEIDTTAGIQESIEEIAGQRTVVLRTTGLARDDSHWANVGWAPLDRNLLAVGDTVELTAIPYALWANRGSSVMRIFGPKWERAATRGGSVDDPT